jgi:hypothetical protein
MTEFVTQAAFAKLRGVSKPTVHGWKKRGYLVFGPDGKSVDVAATEKILADRPATYRGGKTKAARPTPAQLLTAPDWSLAESTRRRQAAMAALAELELALKSGKLLERDAGFALWGSLTVGFRNMYLGTPRQIAFEIPVLTATDRSIIERICRNNLHDAALGRGCYFGDTKAPDDEVPDEEGEKK